MRKKFAATVAAVALGAFALAAPAGAAGGNGASFCSNSQAPDGIVNPEDPTTWANAGEASAISPRRTSLRRRLPQASP